MAIQNASIPVGATYAPTGGTARTIKFLANVTNGIKTFIDDSPASSVLRKILYANVRPAVPEASSIDGYTHEKKKLEFQIPFTNGSGDVVVDKVIIEVWTNVAADATQKTLLRGLISNVGSDADFDDFFVNGGLG